MNSLTKPVLIFPLFVLGLVSGVTAAAEEQTELDRRRLKQLKIAQNRWRTRCLIFLWPYGTVIWIR